MACRNAYRTRTARMEAREFSPAVISVPQASENVRRLLFGADSEINASDLLQNNIDMFEWVVRNKIYPNFFGRYLNGEDSLTREEIKFIHSKGCKIAPIYKGKEAKTTEKHGESVADKVYELAFSLGIPEGTAIFLEIGEDEAISKDFMKGYAKSLMVCGYTPGFKANTDAKFAFDKEFSSGIQNDKETFEKCLVWATAPTVEEYNGITTSHLIHPDEWKPFAPSGITRKEIAVWQYGVECHPIEDDEGKITTCNLDLVRNDRIIIEKMF